MNLQHVLGEIENLDGEVYPSLNTPWSVVRNFKNIGTRSLGTAGLVLSLFLKKVYTPHSKSTQVIATLNHALIFEYLKAEFYKKAIENFVAIGIPESEQKAVCVIKAHENTDVAFLINTIKTFGGAPVAKPTFDFFGNKGKGGGPFEDVFRDYKIFLAVARMLADTAVRACKGRVAELSKAGDILAEALEIQVVEERHSWRMKELRYPAEQIDVEPLFAKFFLETKESYARFGNVVDTMQATIQIKNIRTSRLIGNDAPQPSTEPLTPAQVLAIVDMFIV